MLDFVGWLRSHNDVSITPQGKVGIYGLDLYSLNDSITAVLEYLKEVDPAAAQHFSRRYACFEHFGGNTQRYGLFTGTGISKSCEEEVVSAVAELRRSRGGYRHGGKQATEIIEIRALFKLEVKVFFGEVEMSESVLIHEFDNSTDFLEVHDEKELVLGGWGRPDATLPCRRQASGADEIASSGKRTIASDTV